MRADLASLLRQRRGHFELESGHHGDLWLDLELLCSRPSLVRPLVVELAEQLRPYEIQTICGPLVEGALIGMFVAEELDVEFVYSEQQPDANSSRLFPVTYRIPEGLRGLHNRRVAIANDVINAGSAVQGSLRDLQACGAKVVTIGTLLTLGSKPAELAQEAAVPLETLGTEPNTIWTPEECPLCAAGIPLTSFAAR